MKEAILALVCQSEEFNRVSSKQTERKLLNEMNKVTEFPLKKSAADGPRKVRVLLQASAQDLEVKFFDLKNQMKEYKMVAVRILKCLFRVFLSKGAYVCAEATKFWLMRIMRKVTKVNPHSVFSQIPYLSKRMALELIQSNAIKSTSLCGKLKEFLLMRKG